MNLEKLDRIEMTMDEVKSLFIWKDNNKDLVRNFPVALKEGLIIAGNSLKVAFKIEGMRINFEYYFADDKVMSFTWSVLTRFISNLWTSQILNEKFNDEEQQGLRLDILTLVTSTLAYMTYYNPQIVVRQEAIKRNKKGGNYKGKPKTKPIIINRKKYIITNVEAITKEKLDKQAYTRHKECWLVRGHYRSYKSGKRVWIKPKIHNAKDGLERDINTYKLGLK